MNMEAHQFDWDECFRVALKEGMTAPDLARIIRVPPVSIAKIAFEKGVSLPKGIRGKTPYDYIARGHGNALMLRRKADAAGFMNVKHKDGSYSGRLEDGSYIPTVQKYTEAPVKPKVTNAGTYCAEDLLRFLRECAARSIRPDQVAAILRVPIHRVVYFYGEGSKPLKRRAGLVE